MCLSRRFVDWLLVGRMRRLCGRSSGWSARLGVFGAGRHAYSRLDQNKQEYIDTRCSCGIHMYSSLINP